VRNCEVFTKVDVELGEEELHIPSQRDIGQVWCEIRRDVKANNIKKALLEHSFIQQGKEFAQKHLPPLWRLFPLLWTISTWVALFIHVILIYSLPKGPFGLGILATADESSGLHSKKRNWGLFFNITATLIFMGSNSVIQLLLAPTRSDLDRVHAQKDSMDIGRPGFENFIHANIWRKLIWLILVVSGLGLHALYGAHRHYSLNRC
jgi:hypothetical protein